MGHVMAVKERQAATDEMFDPLKDTIELLKSYSQEMPEDVYLQLQVCCKHNNIESHSDDISCWFILCPNLAELIVMANRNLIKL